jgi:hypothetical protein
MICGSLFVTFITLFPLSIWLILVGISGIFKKELPRLGPNVENAQRYGPFFLGSGISLMISLMLAMAYSQIYVCFFAIAVVLFVGTWALDRPT